MPQHFGYPENAPAPGLLLTLAASLAMLAFAALLLSPIVLFAGGAFLLLSGRAIAAGSAMLATLAALCLYPRRVEEWRWATICPFWTLLRAYFRFSAVCDYDGPLDPSRRYLYAEFPHGIMPFGIMLGNSLIHKERLLPRFGDRPWLGAVADALLVLPVWRHVFGWLGVVSASRRSLERVVDRFNIALLPGGLAEIALASDKEERVFLKERKGFVKFALQHGLDIIPCYHFGHSAMLHQLESKWFLWLCRKTRVAMVVMWGRWCLPIAYPVRVVEAVGKPIRVEKVENPTEKQIHELHALFVVELEKLFEKYKHIAGLQDKKLRIM